ncbi:MAG: hypothetical protein ACTSU5_07205 [Promethearchaeota archaeon]
MSPVSLEYYPAIDGERLLAAKKRIEKNIPHWDPPFFQSPRDHVDLAEVRNVCDGVLGEHDIENVVVLGTGGSIQTMMALSPFTTRNFVPLVSSRASELKRALEKCEREKTCVIPISRGGKTIDINSTLGEFTEYPMIALSSRGPMFEIVKKVGCPIMDVPDLSGRFAGCTNVGIVPAYMAGVDVEGFLSGLEEGYGKNSLKGDVDGNLSLQLATFLHQLYQKGFRNVFNMPYNRWLEGAIGLFVQEISESSGKDGKGLLGTSQKAPICQHSVLELLLGGSKGHTVPIVWNSKEDPDDIELHSSVAEVKGRTAHEIITHQAEATFQAILKRGVPSAKIDLEVPTARQVGELIAFIQNAVYFLCNLLDVNWSDNPSVILGKEICNAALLEDLDRNARRENRKSVAEKSFKNFW